MNFTFLESRELDKEEWNRFVQTARNGSIYTEFDTLNDLSKSWAVLVAGKDSKWLAALPLVTGNRMGMSYSLPLLFTQYLGILYSSAIENMEIEQVIQERMAQILKKRFTFFSAHFAPGSISPEIWERNGYRIWERISYVLKLDRTDSELWNGLSKSLKRNIKRGEKMTGITERITVSEVVSLLRRVKGNELSAISGESYLRYEKRVNALFAQGRVQLLGFRDAEGGLLAGIILLNNGNQIIYSLGAQSVEAKTQGLLAFLLWKGILDSRDSGFGEFDFEGSMHPGIARFFAGFGGDIRNYFKVTHKPFWLPVKL